MRFISPRVHAPVDYLIVALFALAPTLFGFGGLPATLCYVIAVVYALLSLLTAYPLGVVKVIPFPVHGYVELVLGPLFAAAPWLLGFDDVVTARNLFVGVGIAVFLAWLTTDYRAAETDEHQRYLRRHTTAGTGAL